MDFQLALQDLDEAIRLEPAFCGAYAERAKVRLALGKDAGATADFQHFLAAGCGDKKKRADIESQLRRIKSEKFSRDLVRGLVKVAGQPVLTHLHGEELAKAKVAKTQSLKLKHLNRAISLGSNDANAFWMRGALRAGNGEHKAAVEDFNEAIRLRVDCDVAYYLRGISLQQLGDKMSALADLQAYLRISNGDNALVKRADVERIIRALSD
jgi:regulator of sirC expression with transglutaminase-like and TPR domain